MNCRPRKSQIQAREPIQMEKKVMVKKDGRYIIFYGFSREKDERKKPCPS